MDGRGNADPAHRTVAGQDNDQRMAKFLSAARRSGASCGRRLADDAVAGRATYCRDVAHAIPTTTPRSAAHAAMRTMVRTEHTIFMVASLSVARLR
jgi:hypothetical protein